MALSRTTDDICCARDECPVPTLLNHLTMQADRLKEIDSHEADAAREAVELCLTLFRRLHHVGAFNAE